MNEPPQTQMEQFELLLQKRDYKKAEVLVAKSLRAAISTAQRLRWLTARARVRLHSGRIDDALLDVQKIFGLEPNAEADPGLLELLADCHLARYEVSTVGFTDRADADRAKVIYLRILEQHASYINLGWVRYQLGRIHLIEYQPEAAAKCFQDALLEASTFPAHTAYCYERLGFIHFYEFRQADKALHFFNKAVDTYPTHSVRYWLVQAHGMRSRVLREMRRIEEAIDAARTSLLIAETSETKRGLADALLSLAETLAPLPNRERETLNYLQQFTQTAKKPLGIDVTWARVYEMIGDAFYNLAQYNNALRAFEAALQYNPYTPWETSLHYRLARSAYQAGEYRRAIKALDHLIRTAHDDGDAVTDHHIYMVLASSYYALYQYKEAISAYQQAQALVPAGDPDADLIQAYMQRAVDLTPQRP